MRLRSKTTAVIGAAATAGILALGGVAAAQGAGPFESDDDLTEPGTVQVDEAVLPEDDSAEQAILTKLATVDQAAAEAAALDAVGADGSTVAHSELEDEDGFVVWEVDVRRADGTVVEVSIDAGDARVLGTEEDDDDGDDEAEDETEDDAEDDDDD